MAGELIRREALERIIQRAAELQAGEQDIGEGLTEPELLALGQDVGIPSRYLRQALLEEQTRPPAEARGGVLAWLVGPGRLSAQRVVAGEPAVIDRALGTWMPARRRVPRDRKSTRLNSSHGYISYAVFCLKKKKTKGDQSCPRLKAQHGYLLQDTVGLSKQQYRQGSRHRKHQPVELPRQSTSQPAARCHQL